MRAVSADRRSVLRGAAAAAAAAVLGGCSEAVPGASSTGTATRIAGGTGRSAAAGHPSTSSRPPAEPPGPAVEVAHGVRTRSAVALTFHGSGDPVLAERLLRLVEGAGVQVSVLAVGSWLARHPEMAGRVLQGGHDLGNHTMHHLPMRPMSEPQARQEIAGCAAELARVAGSRGRWFRPSAIRRTTAAIRTAAGAEGYRTCVSYDVDGLDWQEPPATTVVSAVLDEIRPGSVVSLHLGHEVTVRALPAVLAGLRSRGLRPVTLTELLG